MSDAVQLGLLSLYGFDDLINEGSLLLHLQLKSLQFSDIGPAQHVLASIGDIVTVVFSCLSPCDLICPERVTAFVSRLML